MANNLTNKFDSYYLTPTELEARLNSTYAPNTQIGYALAEWLSLTEQIAAGLGRHVSQQEIFTAFLGYGYNDPTNVEQSILALNEQLLPLISVVKAMKSVLALP